MNIFNSLKDKVDWRTICVLSLIGIISVSSWYGLDRLLRIITQDAVIASTEESYKQGYKAGANYVHTQLLDDFSELIKISLDNNCKAQNCSSTTNLKEYLLVEKQLNAIMHKSNEKLTKEQKREYVKYITKYANEYELSPILVAAIIHRESNFINKTTSSVGAKGPMQVWAKHHREKLKRHNITEAQLYSTRYGVLIGCEVFKEYLDKENGNYRAALYRYVGGKHHTYVKDIFKMCEYALTVKI